MFINEFITAGLNDLFGERKLFSFERHILECICQIYGISEVKSMYASKDQNGFITLLRKYGYQEENYMRFLGYTAEYEDFKKNLRTNPNLKSDIYNKIESEVITMFGFKFLLDKFNQAEIEQFEKILLNDFETIRLKFNTSLNPNFTKELWEKRKNEFKNSVELSNVKVDYLNEDLYKKFNLDMETVEKMDYRMVERLNKSILDRLNESEEIVTNNVKTKFVLTSGNGFVDILIMVSIITTIISAGIIYFFLR